MYASILYPDKVTEIWASLNNEQKKKSSTYYLNYLNIQGKFEEIINVRLSLYDI